jgi:predicted GNAT family N-acyltransferase
VLEAAEGSARAAGALRVALHAQLPVRDFYEEGGYRSYGEEFEEEGIGHVAMEQRVA